MYNVIEKFVSIDGEGKTAGELAVFIRFAGCNLRCRWCDTRYSWECDNQTQLLTKEEIVSYIKGSKVKNVTLTGGEPLLVPHIEELLALLHEDDSLTVHIETNGSVSIKDWKEAFPKLEFVVDYKLPLSGMFDRMKIENLHAVTSDDVYKFVIAGSQDLNAAYRILSDYNLTQTCCVHFSPVLGSIEPSEIVSFMKEKHLTDVRLQLQLHKLIWHKEARGV